MNIKKFSESHINWRTMVSTQPSASYRPWQQILFTVCGPAISILQSPQQEKFPELETRSH